MNNDVISLALGLIGNGLNLAAALKNYLNARDNQATILANSIVFAKEGTDFSDDAEVNLGWVKDFLDTAKYVSDPDMQTMWGKILAQEFENPGVTPRRIDRILSEITPYDMHKFQLICSMKIGIISEYKGEGQPKVKEYLFVPFLDTDDGCKKLGIWLEDLLELEAMGLINLSSDEYGFHTEAIKYETPLVFANGKTFYVKHFPNNHWPTGHVILTQAGECISNAILPCDLPDVYAEFVWSFLRFSGVELLNQSIYEVKKNEDGIYTVIREKNHSL